MITKFIIIEGHNIIYLSDRYCLTIGDRYMLRLMFTVPMIEKYILGVL